jgi:TPR repeat protein
MARIAFHLTLATASVFIAAFSATSTIAATPTETCDQLASSPFDPTRPEGVPGVLTGDIEIEAAIEACTLAVKTTDAPRYKYQLGRAYFDQENYAAALKEFTAASDDGLAIAKASLGYLYGEGLGVAQNKQRELELTLEAANADIAFAAHNLGVIYRDNDGIAVDHSASLAWFRKAAALGYTQSLVDIGFAYDEGRGVKADFVEARRWYIEAAKYDIVEALNNLGTHYEEGRGVEKNYPSALEWYSKAQAQGYTLAYVNIANLTDAGLGTAADPAAAAVLVLKALEEGNADDDRFNLDYVYEETWSPAFWTAVQTTLSAQKRYKGPVDGTLNAETKTAMNAMIDK